MRIPFPERISLDRVALFAAALFLIQILEGTALYFAVGCVAFIMIAGFAFNVAGGLTRASGAYIFSYSILVVIIGLCYKAFLGEPAQSNLLVPRSDIEAYVCSVTGMFAAVVVSSRLRRRSGLLQNVLIDSKMYRASVGCMAFGIVGVFAIALLGESAVRLQSAFGQLNELIPLGIIIGVMYEIRCSGGTRSTNLAIIIGAFYLFLLGATGFSKQGMLMPIYCWLLPVSALRFRLSAFQVICVFLAIFVVFQYLVPFSQYGRGQVPDESTLSQRIAIAIPLLEHPNKTRQLNDEEAAESGPGLGSYYNTPQGFWERLQFISVDDKLIDVTDEGKVFGLSPLKAALLNTIPRVFWPNKPDINLGNMYSHEILRIPMGVGDTTTGISFSPTAEAYHLATWKGVLVIAPLLWFTLFTVFDSLLGDLRATPWGLLALALISHTAPEAGISGIIGLLSFGIEILVFCAFFAAWFAPIIATSVLGPDKVKSTAKISFRHKLESRIPRLP